MSDRQIISDEAPSMPNLTVSHQLPKMEHKDNPVPKKKNQRVYVRPSDKYKSM